MTCPDTASGDHVWRLELVPEVVSFQPVEVAAQIEPRPTVRFCALCGEIW